ncbi:CDP-alcohol phosphatidyltransferase family protein [[Eubacterium] cellulosolvens]
MVLNKYRGFAEKILTPVARLLSGLHPNTISTVSLLFALLAGIAFAFSDKSSYEDTFKPGHYVYIMLAIGSICVFLNGFLDAVDGRVARMTNRISKRGDLFDHAMDRYADILILGGIMLSPFCDTVLGALAIIGVLMTSYMGTQAQALGCGRDYGGLLGRADRLVILIIAPLLQMWLNYYIPAGRLPLPGVFSLTILEYTMIWFFIAGNATAIHRGIHSWRELRAMEEPQKTLDQYFNISHKKEPVTNPGKIQPPAAATKPQRVIRPTRPAPVEEGFDVVWDEPETRAKPEKRMIAKDKLKAKAPTRRPPRARGTRPTKPKPTRKPTKSKVESKPKHEPVQKSVLAPRSKSKHMWELKQEPKPKLTRKLKAPPRKAKQMKLKSKPSQAAEESDEEAKATKTKLKLKRKTVPIMSAKRRDTKAIKTKAKAAKR